jgi:hypothetical protein
MAWLLDCNFPNLNSIFRHSQTAQIQTLSHQKQLIDDSPVNNANQSGAGQGNAIAQGRAEQATKHPTKSSKRGQKPANLKMLFIWFYLN